MKLRTSLELVIVIGGACGVIWGGLTFIQDRAQDYHDNSMTPVVESLNNIEQSATVERIRGLLTARCDLLNQGRDTEQIENILDAQVVRYQELTGREFPMGGCENGVRTR